jgi:hypothetical protein
MRWTWAAAAAVFAVGLAALILTRTAPPKLVDGSYAQSGDARWRDNPKDFDGPARTLLLHYADGKSATFTLSVRNAGRKPIRITGAYVLGRKLMFATSTARFAPAPGDDGAGAKPAREATVPPGKETAVTLSGRFTNCAAYSPGSETSTDTLTVDYLDKGATRSVDVPLRSEIRIAAPDSCD